MYKMICIDLDGTLLDPQGKISEENKVAIRFALSKGLHVVIVSGRPNCFTARIIREISPEMGHITFNGAFYQVGGKTKQTPIAKASVDAIAAISSQHDLRLYFKNRNLSLCSKDNNGLLDYDSFKDETPVEDQMDMLYNVDVANYLKEHDMDVLKIVSLDESVEHTKEVFNKLQRIPDIHLYGYDTYFEICSSLASKGEGITNVCKELNIQRSEIAAIGDNFNDQPMFDAAGLSIAMDNAPQAIKDHVDKVTLSNEQSGVAYAIYNFILGETL